MDAHGNACRINIYLVLVLPSFVCVIFAKTHMEFFPGEKRAEKMDKEHKKRMKSVRRVWWWIGLLVVGQAATIAFFAYTFLF